MYTFGDSRLPSRFWSKVTAQPDGCWAWSGAKDTTQYGRFSVGTSKKQKIAVAHRHAYEALVGPIPPGLQADHLCRNRGCVNPAHIEPVTARENTLRGVGASAKNARKTHCKRGHALSGWNLYNAPDGGRECITCRRMWNRVADAKRRPRRKTAA